MFNNKVGKPTSRVDLESETQLLSSEPVTKLPSSFKTGIPRPTTCMNKRLLGKKANSLTRPVVTLKQLYY